MQDLTAVGGLVAVEVAEVAQEEGEGVAEVLGPEVVAMTATMAMLMVATNAATAREER